MKEKIFGTAFAVLSLSLCAALSLGLAVFGPADARGNEILADRPALRTEEGWNPDYLPELSAYVQDRFFPRQTLLTLRGKLYALLGSSAVEDVLPGKEGWLYYTPTLPDYAGTPSLDGTDLLSAARNLALMDEYCRGQGIRFLFTVAPNKNSLYPAYMPERIPAGAGVHNAELLYRYLDALGVPYADLFSAFRGEEETLYFAHDTHWNSRGAALAAERICAAFGLEADYCSAGRFSETAPHSGDLYEMLYPGETDPETDLLYGGTLNYTRAGEDTRPDSITISTSGGGQGSLLAFRDSFGNLLYPYLADAFASAQFSRAAAYDLNRAAVLGADCVLVELVERNLSWLLEYVPVMPAPARGEISVSERAPCQAQKDETAMGPAGCVLWRGELPPGADSSRGAANGVYLDCGGAVYEAFVLSGGGYAAWLPAEAVPGTVCYGVS